MSLTSQILIAIALIATSIFLIGFLLSNKKAKKNPISPETATPSAKGPVNQFQRVRREDFLNEIKSLLEVKIKSETEQVDFRLLSASNIIEMLINLRLENHSSHDIRVDKIVWDLWIGGHHIKEGIYVERGSMGPKTVRDDVRLHEILLESQSLDLSVASQSKINSYLEGVVYGETKYGIFRKNFTLMNLKLSFSTDTQTKLQTMMNTSVSDSLTGLLQRKFLDDNLQTIINKNVREHPISFAMIDIDNFKNINDTYGHLVGDDVIRGVCEEIKSAVGERGYCVRYGGDEFAVILQNCHVSAAQSLMEEIRSKVEKREFKIPDGVIRATLSIGISMVVEQVNFKILLKHADDMLRFSKQNGKNKVSIDLRKISSDWNL